SLLFAAAGSGVLPAHRSTPLDEETSSWIGRTPSGSTPPAAGAAADDPAWREALHLLDPDEPGLADLAHALADRCVAAPDVGSELGEAGWQAELAWPSARVGVVLAPPLGTGHGDTVTTPADRAGLIDPEFADRDAAYAAAGWDVRTAAGWNADELAAAV